MEDMKFDQVKIEHLLAAAISLYSAVAAILENYGLIGPITLTDAFNGFVCSVLMLAATICIYCKLGQPRSTTKHDAAHALSRFLGILAFFGVGWVSIALIPLTPVTGILYGIHLGAAKRIQFVPAALCFVALTFAAARRLPLPTIHPVE
jgi:hypothetical protein